MSTIPKEIDSNFGQEVQRPNVCDNAAQGGFFIDCVLAVAGELQYASRDLAARDQPSNFHFYFHAGCKPATGNIRNYNSAHYAHIYSSLRPTSSEHNVYPSR